MVKFNLIQIANKAKAGTVAILVAKYVKELDAYMSVMLFREGHVPSSLLEDTLPCGNAIAAGCKIHVDHTAVVPGWRVGSPKMIAAPTKLAELIGAKIAVLNARIVSEASDAGLEASNKVLASHGLVS